jgi:WSC domain
MTNENCQAACKAGGWTISGTEYSAECYCDSKFENGGGPAPDGSTGCNMACNGNSQEICGGSNRLTVYQYSNGPPSTSSVSTSSATTTSSTSSSSSKSSTSTSSSTSSSTAVPTGWTYQGCYADAYNNLGRTLMYQQPDNAALTRESCISTCAGLGYPVAGMEYYTQCFCDTGLRNSAPKEPETDCNTACGGNSAEECGGPNRLSIYSNGPLPIYQPPSIPKTVSGGNWTYVGCLVDNTNQVRALPHQVVITNNTVENCLNTCGQYGYMVGGPEYGDECYCGTDGDYQANGAVLAPDTDCQVMACPGNASEYCANGNRIAYYKWSGKTPLYTWNYPQGNAAGTYSLLIGGVTVPLMTTVGINGKVTFLEKSGTGKLTCIPSIKRKR